LDGRTGVASSLLVRTCCEGAGRAERAVRWEGSNRPDLRAVGVVGMAREKPAANAVSEE
jgi:hypothetical protein